MIPDFTDDGFLPPGIHLATIEKFEERYVYFNRSDRRLRLYQNLKALIQEARLSGIVLRLLVVGSFVTAKPEPNDFDCVLIVDHRIRDRALGAAEI